MKRICALLLCVCLVMSGSLALGEGWVCNTCGAKDQAYAFCTSCGEKKPACCPACGWWVEEIETFKHCGNCGARLRAYEVGDIVTFGRYEQDGNFGNGKEPIEWIVMGSSNGEYMLMARYGLEEKDYDTSGNTGVTWKTSTLRAWMNKTFLNVAFTEEEIAKIIPTTLVTEQLNQTVQIGTQDTVFLLNGDEYYELEKQLRLAAPAERFEAEHGRICFWWLRDGVAANMEGSLAGFSSENEVDWYIGYGYGDTLVRPCIWVRLP